KRFASNVIQDHKPPETAGVAPIPVVTHNEEMIFRHLRRAVVVPAGGQNILRIVPLEMCMRVLHLLAVDVYFFTPHFYRISGDADNPLDKILRTILWENKHNHIAPLDLPEIHKIMAPNRNTYPIGQLVHQDMIADLESGNHRAGRYLESLNDKSAYEQR